MSHGLGLLWAHTVHQRASDFLWMALNVRLNADFTIVEILKIFLTDKASCRFEIVQAFYLQHVSGLLKCIVVCSVWIITTTAKSLQKICSV